MQQTGQRNGPPRAFVADAFVFSSCFFVHTLLKSPNSHSRVSSGECNMVNTTSSASDYKGIKGPLRHRCSHCQAAGPKLLRCNGCLVIRYCNREHQAAHWPEHKSACSKIKKARAKLAEEDLAVRNAGDDSFMTPANAFETHVGHFWGIVSTRDYMRARMSLVVKLLLQGTLGSVSEAHEHMRDMLRLNRSDNMALRDMLPAVMLRLDLDQECYDFVKWWATCDSDGEYDWGDMTLPYLNLHGADVFEDPKFLIVEHAELNPLVAVLLLKLKLLVDIHNLKITRKILARSRLPVELHKTIELAVVRSPLSTKFQKEVSGSLLQIESTLLSHIRRLGAVVVEANGDFIFHLFDPDEALCSMPETCTRGCWDEVALAIQHSYAAWWETVGVLDLLQDARMCAARDAEDEVADMMKEMTFKSEAGSQRMAKALLEDASVNRIWECLDYAAENASWLGSWSERPSERHTRPSKQSWARAEEQDEKECSDDED
ncbi:hypothetical protein GGI35DRAFT_448917 [Trichoderma velutinum]